MKIAVLGGGPAGLYFAYRFKRANPQVEIAVFEQNPQGATWGFGVVFSDRALEFLRADDAETVDLITRHMETWRDITVVHKGETIPIDGVGFSAIGRLELLRLLRERAASVGVHPHYGTAINSMDELAGYDLIVAADGINSLARRTYERDFGTTHGTLDNKFVWFGTTKPFDTLTQTFVQTPLGYFNAHHYRYAPDASTFIVECDPQTWQRYAFADKNDAETRATCEEVFAAALGGHKLISNRSAWRHFPWIWNERWCHRNIVLVGDALRTAHYSIGSGTRLALEDVIALLAALQAEPANLQAAFARYERERRPPVEKLVKASHASAAWYDRFADHMALEPVDFAHAYLSRVGRMSEAALQSMAPSFMRRHAAHIASR